MVGYQEVKLLPGQFIFGRQKAAADLNMSEKSIRTCLTGLRSAQKLAIKSASKFSIITVINWDTYKGYDNAEGPAKRPAKGQQRATNNNGNNGNIESIAQFNLFYEAYPRHVGKEPALKVWLRNPEYSNGLYDTIMRTLKRHTETLFKGREKKHIPYPATWLNSKPWNDAGGEDTGSTQYPYIGGGW